jgi:hypothetical protein
LVERHHDQAIVILGHDRVDFLLLVTAPICVFADNNTHGRKNVVLGPSEFLAKGLGLRVDRVASFIVMLDIFVRIER